MKFEDLQEKVFKAFDKATKNLEEITAAAINELAEEPSAAVGTVVYRIEVNEGACEACEAHAGRIYTVAEIESNRPPYHPNCKC